MRSIFKLSLRASLAVLAFGMIAAASAVAEEGPHFRTTVAGKLTALGRATTITARVGGPWRYQETEFAGEMSSKTTFDHATLAFMRGEEARGCDNGEGAGMGHKLTISGLDARLGWINKEKGEVGLMFYHPNQSLAKCYWYSKGEPTELLGEVIAKVVSPALNTISRHLTLRFETQLFEADRQLPEYFEGETKHGQTFPLDAGGKYKCEIVKTKNGEEERCTPGPWAVGINSEEINIELPEAIELLT